MTIRAVRFQFNVYVQIDIDRANMEAVDEAEKKALDKLQQLSHLTDQAIQLVGWQMVEGPAKETK